MWPAGVRQSVAIGRKEFPRDELGWILGWSRSEMEIRKFLGGIPLDTRMWHLGKGNTTPPPSTPVRLRS
jgi:hypothetical protein